MKTLEYYFVRKGVIEHVIFNKYTIDENGIIKNKETGKSMAIHINKGGYNMCSVQNKTGKQSKLLLGRALVSTFEGQPPTPGHTADHKDRNKVNDTLNNITWLDATGQKGNRDMPDAFKSAFIITRYGDEKTANQWQEYLKDQKNHMGRNYTKGMIITYAQKKKHEFSYKEYSDLPGEIWKEVKNSKNGRKGYWEISNMNRVKYVTKFAENVFSGERIGLSNGYPNIIINGKNLRCHILSFMTFFPEEYANKKSNEIILHEDDNRLDFRPHKLRLGTQTENMIDAHSNGCYNDTGSERVVCISYVNGVFEKEHESQADAVKYLKSLDYAKASKSGIGKALEAYRKGETRVRYGRTWKLV
jgi:hypothetical protein